MRTTNKEMKHLVLFIIITLFWTWSFGFIPVVLRIEGTTLGTFLFYFGGGAPSVTALFFVFLTYSKKQKRDYFKRCFSFRYMGLKWPLLIIAFFTIITVVGLLIGVNLLGFEMPGTNKLPATRILQRSTRGQQEMGDCSPEVLATSSEQQRPSIVKTNSMLPKTNK